MSLKMDHELKKLQLGNLQKFYLILGLINLF